MPIYNGSTKQKDLYYGGSKIKEAYYGSTKVYSSAKPLYYCYVFGGEYYWYFQEEMTYVGQTQQWKSKGSSYTQASSTSELTYTGGNTTVGTITSDGFTEQAFGIQFTRVPSGDLYT